MPLILLFAVQEGTIFSNYQANLSLYRFDREIMIDVPNRFQRHAILKFLTRKLPLDPTMSLELLADLTNGYVGSDLNALCREATLKAAHMNRDFSIISKLHFDFALEKIVPSVRRGLEIPIQKVSWEDVGGLDHVKSRLKQAVEWPLLHQSTFTRLGLQSPRGILLYGPPGCSKTTFAKV